jgi:hypothetical protein
MTWLCGVGDERQIEVRGSWRAARATISGERRLMCVDEAMTAR